MGLRETDVACFAVDAANGRVRFPKIGWLRYRASRPVEGRPITVTLTSELDGWYVAIATEQRLAAAPEHASTAIAGIDGGSTPYQIPRTFAVKPGIAQMP